MEDINDYLERRKGLVIAVARRKFPAMAGDEDLLQCGLIGLWRARESFQPEKGVKFATYAYRCIENAMRDYQRQQLRQTGRELFADDMDKPPAALTTAAPDGAVISKIDIANAIKKAYPQDSTECKILWALLISGRSKRAIAREWGMTTGQLTRFVRRAGKRLGVEG